MSTEVFPVGQLTISRIEYLLNKVDKMAGCWNFSGTLSHNGYMNTSIKGKPFRAHRVFYMLFKGKIPNGYTVDHTCYNKVCVNPKHLEAVTIGENVRRYHDKQTHCPRGHEYSSENVYFYKKKGFKQCRLCKNINLKSFRLRSKVS